MAWNCCVIQSFLIQKNKTLWLTEIQAGADLRLWIRKNNDVLRAWAAAPPMAAGAVITKTIMMKKMMTIMTTATMMKMMMTTM
jgi:hypothetical protein